MTQSHISVLKSQSSFYQTEPVDYTDQDWFVNGVVKIETRLDPSSLLKQVKQIEAAAGRTHHGFRFGPRVLDLDILIYDDLVLTTDNLVIPHPRMHKRRFVLQPFCDIDPGIKHPVLGGTMEDLLGELPRDEQTVSGYE